MKTVSPALQALLASRSFLAFDLFTLTLSNGMAFYYSGGDADVFWGGNRYLCGGQTGPFWGKDGNRSMLHQKLGTDVDTFYVGLLPGSSTIMNYSWGEARRNGLLQGAWLQYSRAYFPLPFTFAVWPLVPVGVLPRFLGIVGAIDGGGADLVVSVNSPLNILQLSLPRNLYQPNCLNSFGDQACGINLAAYTNADSAQAASNALNIVCGNAFAADYYDHGMLTFTSGINAGFSRSVETSANQVINLATPFFYAPSVGDRFTLTPGCDKSFLCCAKYTNTANIRCHPFVPPPATGQP